MECYAIATRNHTKRNMQHATHLINALTPYRLCPNLLMFDGRMLLRLPLLDELLRSGAVAVVSAKVVDVEHVPVLFVAYIDKRRGTHDACIGDHDVQRTECGDGVGDKVVDGRSGAYVGEVC